MKRIYLIALLLLICLCLCACSAASNPLENAQATAVPGLSMELHAASAGTADAFTATLYFRYLDQPMLASESRTLYVERDESNEYAVVRALLEGPSAGYMELNRLFGEDVRVTSVSSRDGILYITFNSALLSDAELPQDWRSRPEWVTEAPLVRRLAIQSLVATITESFPYTAVQVLVGSGSNAQTNLRLDNSYFLSGQTGLSDPQIRDESLLLTPHNTAQRILDAWQTRDYETLYAYTANINGDESRPVYDSFAEALDSCATLSACSVSAGNVAHDGTRAVLTVSLATHRSGEIDEIPAYPMPLVRENGAWKITFSELQAMMLR